MEERVSGFAVTGDWSDIVEHGERITAALEAAGVDESALEAWESWRPKPAERIDEEMSEKTAAEASVGEGPGEQADASAGDDLQQAGEKLSESYDALREGGFDEARESLGESAGYAGRAADTASRRATRAIEKRLYEDVMTRVSPYYFDSDLVSANLGRDGDEYLLEVDINDDDLKTAVGEWLDEHEDDRWQIDAEPETGSVEATTGTDLPAETD